MENEYLIVERYKVKAMELDMAIKSVFKQCLDDSEIIELIKRKLDNIEKKTNLIEQTNECVNKEINSSNNYIGGDISEKINEILELQYYIKDRLSVTYCEEAKRVTEKLNSERKENSQKIEKVERECIQQINTYKKDVLEKESKIKSLSVEIQSKENIINELKEKNTICEEILLVWNNVKELNKDNKEYLVELVGGWDILAFISLGRDESKIEQLWMFLRDLIVKGDMHKKDIKILNSYFEFCIKVCNLTKPEEERYCVSKIEIGDEFDVDQSIRTADSKQIGKIKEVVVNGYTYKGAMQYKSIVIVE